MKYRLPAPFHIFQIDGMNGGTIEMDPFQGPQIFGALVEIWRLTIDEYTVTGRNGIFLFLIIKDPAAGNNIEEKIRHQIPAAADMGLYSPETADLLQIKEIGPGKFRRSVKDTVGIDGFSLKERIVHRHWFLLNGNYPDYILKVNIMQMNGNIIHFTGIKNWIS